MKRPATLSFVLVCAAAMSARAGIEPLDPNVVELVQELEMMGQRIKAHAAHQVENKSHPAEEALKLWIYNEGEEKFMRSRSQYEAVAGFQLDREEGHRESKALIRAQDPEQFFENLRALVASGRKVRDFGILAHGSPGSTDLLDRKNVVELSRIEGLSEAFVAGARVFLRSCNVANGPVGARFVLDVGRGFVGKNGGSVWAPNAFFLELPFIGGSLSTGKGYRELRLEPGGRDFFLDGYEKKDKPVERIRKGIAGLEEDLEQAAPTHEGNGYWFVRGFLDTAALKLDSPTASKEDLIDADVALADARHQFQRYFGD